MSEVQSAKSEGGEQEQVEAATLKMQKRIEEAFDIFDHEGNKTVDVREVGTIMRSLDLCPTENELNDVLAEMDEQDASGYIRLERFLPVITLAMKNKNFRPHPEEKIFKAFQTLDPEGNGYISSEALKQYFITEGEPFNEEEIEEMLSAAPDDKGNIVFKEYVPLLTVEEQLG